MGSSKGSLSSTFGAQDRRAERMARIRLLSIKRMQQTDAVRFSKEGHCSYAAGKHRQAIRIWELGR